MFFHNIRAFLLRKVPLIEFLLANPRRFLGWPVLTLVVSTFFCGALYFKLDAERKALKADGLQETASFAKAYAQQLVHTIEAIDQTSMALRDFWEQSSGSVRLEEMKNAGSFVAPQFGFVSIYDRYGALATSTVAVTNPVSISDKNYFKFHQNNNSDALQISTPEFDTLTDRTVLQFTRRLSRPGDEFDGVVVLSIAPEFFVQFSDPGTLGQTGVLALLDSDGAPRAATVRSDARAASDFLGFNLPSTAIGGPAVLLDGERWFADKKARFFAAQPLASYPLFAAVGLGVEERLAPYRHARVAYTQLAIGGTLAMIVFGIAMAAMALLLASRQRNVESIRESYRTATEGANEGFFMWQSILDHAGNVADFELVDCNERGASLYSANKDKLIGKKISTLYTTADVENILKTCQIVLEKGFHDDEFEVQPESPIAASWLYRKFVPFGNRIAVTLRDITDKKQYESELSRLATQDALTGLPNRHWLMNYLPEALNRASTRREMLAIMFVDLDNFKDVNDSAGHSVGDQLLQAVASRLRTVLRPTDNVARFGGDEFVVVLDTVRGEDEVAQVARRVLQSLQDPFLLAGRQTMVGGSIGIAVFPRDGTDAEDLLKHADIAMYAAKGEKKGTFRFYSGEFYERMQTRLNAEHALAQAIEGDQFVLHYQPRVETASGKLVGMEALVRWAHPEKGLISPNDFIPLAESTGLILPLGDLVMDKVCAQISLWKKEGAPVVPVSVNVSARQFNEGKVERHLSACLDKHHLASHLIEIELTESAMMGDWDLVSQEMEALNALGVKIHVDDFGTGYSSLSLLNQLDMDVLKIDRFFTSKLGAGLEGEIFFKAIVSMAQALGMRVVAEGVETKEQLALLQALSCDEIQGYLISRPLPAERIPEMLRQGSFSI